MLGSLRDICEGSSRLQQVQYATPDDDPDVITAVGLRYRDITVVFRTADGDCSDWLTLGLAPLRAGTGEVLHDVSADPLWRNLVEMHTSWAWWMTNQRGLTDGVRLEFRDGHGTPRECVELVAWGGYIYVYRTRDFYGDECPRADSGRAPRAEPGAAPAPAT